MLKPASPTCMSGEELSDEDLMTLFEAARWAPSSYIINLGDLSTQRESQKAGINSSPLLAEGNKIWAKDSAALVVLISRKNFEFNEKPSVTHQLDAGAEWENLALEACFQGFVTHGMEEFDYQRARQELGIPENYDVMAMIAIGKRGSKENLPPKLRDMEFPNIRKPLKEIVMEGKFRS